jgi:hypothetical protein
MGSRFAVYTRIFATLVRLCRDEVGNIKQFVTLAWMVVGVLHARSIAPSNLAPYLPGAIRAASHEARVRRWLKNPHVDVWQRDQPLRGAGLAGWERANISLFLDGTCVGNGRWTVWRLSMAHGCRAFPVAWTVTAGTGSVRVERRDPMLRAVATWVQGRVCHVTFLADRGVHDDRWAKRARELGWDYAIRLPWSTTVTVRDGQVRRIDDRGVAVGKRAFFQRVRVTAEGQWQAHLAITWTTPTAKQPAESVAVMANRKANRRRLRVDLKRMRIEQSVRDDKSAGFDMAHTTVNAAARIERVLLAVAIATLWCHELGEEGLTTERRRRVDPGWKRELSIFQLGLRWLARCLATFPQRLSPFSASLRLFAYFPVCHNGDVKSVRVSAPHPLDARNITTRPMLRIYLPICASPEAG